VNVKEREDIVGGRKGSMRIRTWAPCWYPATHLKMSLRRGAQQSC